jgi:hypothetical protein
MPSHVSAHRVYLRKRDMHGDGDASPKMPMNPHNSESYIGPKSGII